MNRFPPLLLVTLMISPLLHAKPLNYAIDTESTAIQLTWRAFGGVQSWANIHGVTGDVTLDPQNEFNDRIRVKIPVATLVASNALLTWQLKSNLFFDAGRYPYITFISDRVVMQDAGHMRIFGSLRVKDIRRPVILDTTLEAQTGLSPEDGDLALHAASAISRSAYNMDSFAMVVDDRIAIAIAIRATRS
ncbi:polyisoprenoid-binding protein YceI [Raoultella sp. BIGb0138]|uniref:YceI family protein n=1 Tax=Raoultella sp. BIGb0138 TaxID=2485115 RepID=UPI00104E43BD|nr:YceI family protein [Raoultella sp. BIGb0138]TCW17586.1 polyisoprenoid-binding protein YceI [Raoultella sp. BIGb0138]